MLGLISATQNITKKRMVKNVIAARVITLGGLTILLLLGAIVWHLLRVVLPLAQTPDIDAQTEWRLTNNHAIVAVGDLDNNQPIWFTSDCALTFGYPSTDEIILYTGKPLITDCRESIKIATVNREQWLFRYQSDHHIIIEKLSASSTDFTTELIGQYALSGLGIEQREQPLNDQDWLINVDAQDISVTIKTNGRWLLFTLPYGGLEEVQAGRTTELNRLALAGVSIDAEQLVLLPEYRQSVGLKSDTITFYDERGRVLSTQTFDTPVERISTNDSQRSVFVEMASGQLHRLTVSNEQGRFVYTANTIFDIKAPVLASAYSPNEQSALFLTTGNELVFANMVTGEILERQPLTAESGLQLNGADWVSLQQEKLYVASGSLLHAWLFYEHSSVTTRALFHKIWYEGYTQSGYIWQSTPSNNQTEVKFSLVPLIIGSLKSALLAMVVAVPLALGAAIYTAYFSPVAIRNLLKPVIEFLEAIPSVVIGFVAAGWMATMTLSTLSSLLMSVLLLPVILWLFALVNHRVIRRLPKKWHHGAEWFVASVILILLYWLTQLGMVLIDTDVTLFANTFLDLSQWNKSTLVVALALGIAVVPTIYSIAEDAIYDVPISLRQASFALGATQLQTLRKVVLVAALPSIVSAIILGFSRAFGETILVLMITGNTPVADWDLLVGLRSMTANLAIELPEAEVNSTHYRVLFLTSLILFVFTFMVNTLAEWIRGNVRRRYRYV